MLTRNRRHAGFLLPGIRHDIVDKNFASRLDTSIFNACMFLVTNTTNRPDLLSPDYWRHHSYELIKILLVCVLQDRPLNGCDIAKEIE